MPKYKYKCPGCHRFVGKHQKTRAHVQVCCPDLLNKISIEDAIQKKCKVTKVKRAEMVFVPIQDQPQSDPSKIMVVGAKLNKQKPGKRCSKSKGKCQIYVHPTRIFLMACQKCGYSCDYSNHVSEYNRFRRKTRKELGLLSITAPLDGPSCSLLEKVCRSCGIQSNTAMPHVTFVEGLLPDKQNLDKYLLQLKSLRMALIVDSSLKVCKIHSIPRRSDSTTRLIVADVMVRTSVAKAVDAICNEEHGFTVLPQFPFHVALGACDKDRIDDAIQQASQRLLGDGVVLASDPNQLSVLPPLVDDKLFLQQQTLSSSSEHGEASHEEQAKATLAKFPAIQVAMEMADNLNESLAAAQVFTWKRTATDVNDCSLPTSARDASDDNKK